MRTLLLLLILCLSMHSQAQTCADLFSHSDYTASAWMKKGQEIMADVISEKNSSPNMIITRMTGELAQIPQHGKVGNTTEKNFMAFYSDKLSQADRSALTHVVRMSLAADPNAFANGRGEDPTLSGLRYLSMDLDKVASEAQALKVKLLFTSEDTGVRPINLLFSNDIYVFGMPKKEISKVDGKAYSLVPFLRHDIEHAFDSLEARRNINERHRDFLFKGGFDYQKIMASLAPREQVLFDLGYFLAFHEMYFGLLKLGSIDESNGFGTITASTSPHTPAQLFSVYRDSSEMLYRLRFESGKLRVYFDNIVSTRDGESINPMILRFLDKSDMYVHLPIEIKAQVTAAPNAEARQSIIREFLDEMTSFFLNSHFEHYSAQML